MNENKKNEDKKESILASTVNLDTVGLEDLGKMLRENSSDRTAFNIEGSRLGNL